MCVRAPTVQLSPIHTCASITAPSPMDVPFSITVYGPMWTSLPSVTEGSTSAVGWTPGARTGSGGANSFAAAMHAWFGSATRMIAHGAPRSQSGGSSTALAFVA